MHSHCMHLDVTHFDTEIIARREGTINHVCYHNKCSSFKIFLIVVRLVEAKISEFLFAGLFCHLPLSLYHDISWYTNERGTLFMSLMDSIHFEISPFFTDDKE